MKHFFSFLCLSMVIGTVVAQHNADAYLVARRQAAALPDGVTSLFLNEGRLCCRASDMVFVACRVGTSVVAWEADTILNRIDGDISYCVTNPLSNHLFFSQQDRRRRNSLAELLPRDGKSPKVQKVKLGDVKSSIDHPAFSSDGSLMVFASASCEGYGGSDLFFSVYANGEWSMPVNMGCLLNSAGNEIAPCIVDNALVYASNRGGDSTSYALYAAPLICSMTAGDTVGMYPVGRIAPSLFPVPVNGGGSVLDFVYDAASHTLYWIADDHGRLVLYGAEGSVPSLSLSGNVTDGNDYPVARVSYAVEQQGMIVARGTTDANGCYVLPLRPDVAYRVTFSKEGYFSFSVATDTLRTSKIRWLGSSAAVHATAVLPVTLAALPTDQPIEFQDLFGGSVDVELSAAAEDQLSDVVRFLRDNPQYRATVSLRNDISRDRDFNQNLTQQRIETLRKFFSLRLPDTDISFDNDCLYGSGCCQGSGFSVVSIVLR